MEHQPIEAAEAAPARFTVERTAFAKATEFLARNIVERRNTIPILSNVVVAARADGGLELTGTDLDITARITLAAESAVEVPGSFTVGAEALADIAKKAAGGTFEIREDVAAAKEATAPGAVRRYSAGRASIFIGRARNTLATLPIDDFPNPAEPVAGPGASLFTLPAAQLAETLARVAFAMSKEETRYYLNGVALQLRTVAGTRSLAFVATDGHRMARVAAAVPDGAEALPDIILPRKLVTVLQRALKAFPGDDVTFLVTPDGHRIAIAIGALYLVSKAIDGTYPDWQAVDPDANGAELQRLAFVDLDPDIRAADVTLISKAFGHMPDVFTGPGVSVFTSATAPGFLALAIHLTGDKSGTAAYEIETGAAVEYAKGLARASGIDVDALIYAPAPYRLPVASKPGRRGRKAAKPELGELVTPTPYLPYTIHHARGLVSSITFGRIERHAGEEWVEVPCYETFTTKHEKVAVAEMWAEGSFSISFPADKRAMAARVSFGEGADEVPLRTHANGTIELSEAAVRRLAGDIADMPRVAIPRLTFHQGEIVAIDGVATDGTGRRVIAAAAPKLAGAKGKARGMTDREAIAAYCADPDGVMAQLQPRYFDAATTAAEPAAESTPAPEGICPGPIFPGRTWPAALAEALEYPGVHLESLDGVVSIVANRRPKQRTRIPVRYQGAAREAFEEQARRVAAVAPPETPEIEAPEIEPVELPGELPGREPELPGECEPEPAPYPVPDGRLEALEAAVAALQARVAAMTPGEAPAVPSERETALEAENVALRAEIARLKGKRSATGGRLVKLRAAVAGAIARADHAEERAARYLRHLSAARAEIATLRPFAPAADRPPIIAPGVRLRIAA